MTIKNRVEKLERRHGTAGKTYFAVQRDGDNYEIGGKVLPQREIEKMVKANDTIFWVDREDKNND